MDSNWKRAAIGACTATAVALTAGLALGPAAQAATTPVGGGLLGGTTSTVNGLTSGATSTVNGVTSGATSTVNGVTTGVTNVAGGSTSGSTSGTTAALTSTVNGLLNGLLTGTSTTSPVTVGTSDGVSVGVNGGGNGVTVTLGGSDGTATTTVSTGGTPSVPDTGTPGTPTTTGSGGGTGSTGSGGTGGTGGSGGTGSSGGGTAPVVTALRIAASVDTVYPRKDGYRDTAVLHVTGTTASGKAAPVHGVVVVKLGDTEVKRWTIGSSTEDLTWDGLKGGMIVAGKYDVTGVAIDATGNAVGATESLSVSAKRLVTTSHSFTSKAISGTHAMAAKAKAGLKTGKVQLRLTTKATGVVGKQYLVFAKKGKKLKVLIKNGTHTTKAITVPRSFTSYTLSHTWKKGTVKLSSVVYKYRYKKLR